MLTVSDSILELFEVNWFTHGKDMDWNEKESIGITQEFNDGEKLAQVKYGVGQKAINSYLDSFGLQKI